MGPQHDATSIGGDAEEKEDNNKSGEVKTSEKKDHNDNNRCKSYWKKVEKNLTNKEKRVFVAETLAILTKVIMNNHVYEFGGETKLKEGKETWLSWLCYGGQKD